jgi:hypothetical protein
MSSFVRYVNESVQFNNGVPANPSSKACLLFGQRLTDGTLYPSTGGNTQPNLYEPILLPSFASGDLALQYLGTLGLQYTLGINFTQTLPAPTAVVSSNNLTTLTWSSIPTNFSQLVGFALSGTLAQTSPSSVSGPVYSANIITGVATLVVVGTVAFANAGSSGGVLTLTGVNNVDYPDPVATDPICLLVWDYYQSALSAAGSPNGAPFAYISITGDRDPSVSPVNTPIVLGDPTAVTTGTTSTLTYPIDTAGLGYLPTTTLGATTVTQDTSDATGTYAGYVIEGSNVVITVTGVSGGPFTTTDSVSVVLDTTITAFDFLNGISLYGCCLQQPIDTLDDITETYSDFYDGVEVLNEDNQVLNGHYITYAVAGNITSLPTSAVTLPAPNTFQDILVTYPYVYKFGGIPYDNAAGTVASGRVAAAALYMLANGAAPFPPLTSATINHLPVSSVASTTSYSFAQNGTGDIAINQGWLPLAPNTSGVVTFLESVTSLITVPGTTTPDIEFRYTHVWDCIRWIKQNVGELFEQISILPNNAGSVLMSPAFLKQFRQAIIGVLSKGQNLGIIENLALYEDLVSVTQDTVNPNQVDVYVPSQLIPQVNGANILINIFSSLITNFNPQ